MALFDKTIVVSVAGAFLIGITVGYIIASQQLSKPAPLVTKKITSKEKLISSSDVQPQASHQLAYATREKKTESIALVQSRSSEAIKASLEQLDDETLLNYAYKTGVLSAQIIDNFSQPRTSLYRLLDIALADASDEQPEKTITSQVMFSQTAFHEQAYALQDYFTEDVKHIFAYFELPDYNEHQVLIKWSHQQSGKVVLMKNLPIKTQDLLHHIYIKKTLWQPGEYIVEVYGLSDDIPLLAKGFYRVDGNY